MELFRLQVLDGLVARDEIVRKSASDDPQLVDSVLRALAVEQAELGWSVRRARARRTMDATRLSGQRIKVLVRIAALVVSRAKRGPSPDAPIPEHTLARVRDLFLAQVGEVARDTVGTELAQELLTAVRERIAGPVPGDLAPEIEPDPAVT